MEALTKVHEAIEAEKKLGAYKLGELDPQFYQDIIDILKSNPYELGDLHNKLSKLSKIRRLKLINIISLVKRESAELQNLTKEEDVLRSTIYKAFDIFEESTTGRILR